MSKITARTMHVLLRWPRRSAYGDAVEPDGRQPDPDRDALALLAAGPDAGIKLEIVADHADAGERIGAIADQGCSLDRRTDLAVLDAISLGAGEHELARGDVDLTAAEGNGIEPAWHGGEDLAR